VRPRPLYCSSPSRTPSSSDPTTGSGGNSIVRLVALARETGAGPPEALADQILVAAHAALFAHANFGGLALGLRELDCEWDVEDADAGAAAIPARYQITYRTHVHDLASQG
jgi:hypothetical protein